MGFVTAFSSEWSIIVFAAAVAIFMIMDPMGWLPIPNWLGLNS